MTQPTSVQHLQVNFLAMRMEKRSGQRLLQRMCGRESVKRTLILKLTTHLQVLAMR